MNPALSSDRCLLVSEPCELFLRTLEESSIDSVVCDPPYELGFMGKSWDASGIAYSPAMWREVLRVLKPGGHLLAFGGTRTYHRMTCAIEDAGFEIRDSLHWIYGTGFPKSMNVSEGRGTALKPAHEPIVMARKPLIGTVAKNLEACGTGALNIDVCRLTPGDGKTRDGEQTADTRYTEVGGTDFAMKPGVRGGSAQGRWPANVLFDEDAAAELDAQAGVRVSGSRKAGVYGGMGFHGSGEWPMPETSSSGGASRFFYVAKPSRKERDFGCAALPVRSGGEATDREDGSDGLKSPRAGAGRTGGARNFHPTVKPVELMRYLCRLVTPPGGVVLDPFTGSGTTGIAAIREGFSFVGVEKTPEYVEIAKARIQAALDEGAANDNTECPGESSQKQEVA